MPNTGLKFWLIKEVVRYGCEFSIHHYRFHHWGGRRRRPPTVMEAAGGHASICLHSGGWKIDIYPYPMKTTWLIIQVGLDWVWALVLLLSLEVYVLWFWYAHFGFDNDDHVCIWWETIVEIIWNRWMSHYVRDLLIFASRFHIMFTLWWKCYDLLNMATDQS